MKSAVFFDIDGTLWNYEFKLPASLENAIMRLRENGHYAFINTGRSRANLTDRNLLDLPFNGIVAGCGTYIEMNDEILYEYKMEQQLIARLRNSLKRNNMPVIFEGSRFLYADLEEFKNNGYIEYVEATVGAALKTITGNEGNYDINKMSAETCEESSKIFMEEFDEHMDFILHDVDIIEIVPKGFSKASGIEKVCELLGIEKENTYAFGDSANDKEMIEYAEHGIAMGNGTDEIKAIADYVTDTVDNDGILKGLEHFGLI